MKETFIIYLLNEWMKMRKLRVAAHWNIFGQTQESRGERCKDISTRTLYPQLEEWEVCFPDEYLILAKKTRGMIVSKDFIYPCSMGPSSFKITIGGLPAVTQQIKIQLVSAAAWVPTDAWVWSLAWHSGLRIWCCQICGIVCSCGWSSIPNLGTSICRGAS